MNKEEVLKMIVDAEPQKGECISVEVGKVLGDSLKGLHTEVKGGFMSLTKTLLIAMSTNEELKHIIQLACYASFHIDVDSVKMPPIPDEEEGGEA